MEQLFTLGARVGAALKARNHTIAIAESSTGGLISAALLAVPGASAYYLGGGVIYTPRARHRLLDLKREDMVGYKSATEPYATLLAETARTRFRTIWGLGETGATGPTGNPYGDAAGHCCYAIAGPLAGATKDAGPVVEARTLETGSPDRLGNMQAFSVAALTLLLEAIEKS
jgi:nicotinamide-nucleotide amidase